MLVLFSGVARAVYKTVKEIAEYVGCMSIGEAKRILNMREGDEMTREIVKRSAEKIRSKNQKITPKPEYLIKKIDSAEKVLLRGIE